MNQEAIEFFKALKQDEYAFTERDKEMFDVAIKALEQVPTCGTCRNEDTYHCAECENKSDYEQVQADGEYIPKQAVLENIDQWYEDKADIEDLIVKITYIQGVAIPTAEPKYCDRNICFRNEYNGIGCDECEVTKSQEPCEDAISRQAAIDVIYDNEYKKDMRKALEALPSVKQQEPTGHWIEGKYKDTCDKCRCTYPKNIGFKNYCPNCGAKMIEPQERSEE